MSGTLEQALPRFLRGVLTQGSPSLAFLHIGLPDPTPAHHHPWRDLMMAEIHDVMPSDIVASAPTPIEFRNGH
jgi:hypothetical protein